MLKKLIIVIIVVYGFSGCKSKDVFNYSQDFVKKEQSLLPDITKTENLVRGYMDTKRYDSIAIAGEKMETIVAAKMKEIKDTPAPNAKEADNFKEACLRYFDYVKSIYTGYKNFGLAKTEDERQQKLKEVIELAGKKDDAIKAIQAAQKKYADANNFKLEHQNFSK